MGSGTKTVKANNINSRKAMSKMVDYEDKNFINYIVMILIAIFLCVIPFYRGLYFRENYIPSIIYISSIFLFYLLHKMVRKEYRIISSYFDIIVLLLPVAYLISFFFSINTKEAFDSILKYSGYFMLYKIISDIFNDKNSIKLFSAGILSSIFLVAFTGMLTMAGFIENKGITLYNRLYGLYQYPNTTGAILGCGLLIGIGILIQESNFKWKVFYQLLLNTIFPAFVFTMSLGSFLTFGIISLIYFVITSYRDKFNLLLNAVVLAISSAPLIFDYFKNNLKGMFLLYYVIALAVGVLLQLILHRINRKLSVEKNNRLIIIMTAAIILIVLAVTIIAVTGSDYLQTKISSLLINDLKSQNATDRIVFTKDGFKIFSDNFLVGIGGGGWKDIYLKYQSFPYNSKEAHNFYIQTMIETGIFGTLALVSLILLILKKAFKDIIYKNNEKLTPIYLGVFMILGHAALDFDLSLSAPMFLLWALIGLISIDTEQKFQLKGEHWVAGAVAIILSFGILFSSTSIYLGIVNGNKAAKIVNSDMKQAEVMYKKAIKMDKFNGAYRMDYAQVLNKYYIESRNSKYLELILSNIEEVSKYEPNNLKYKAVVISLLLNSGHVDEGIEEANNLTNIGPLLEDSYMTKAQVNLQIAQYCLKQKKYENAVSYLNNVIDMEQQLKAAVARSIKPFKVSDKIYELIEQAKTVKGQIESTVK